MLNVDALVEIVKRHGFKPEDMPNIMEAMMLLILDMRKIYPHATAAEAIAHLSENKPKDEFQAVIVATAMEAMHQVLANHMNDNQSN